MDYELIRSRRRSLAIEITADGSVLVRAPKRMCPEEIEAFLKQKESWIQKHLEETDRRKKEEGPDIRLTGKELDELKKAARDFFPDRVKYFADKMGITYGRITVKCQHTVWGSCSAKGNLNFNCLLMLMGDEIRDYIIVHELSHRRHMDHSAAFWKTVESVLPDFRERRALLKKEGRPLLNAIVSTEEGTGKYYTYILRCSDNTYYTGYTNDLEKRVNAHNCGKGAKYTRVRRPVALVYSEVYDTKQKAQRREALIKQMTKREKEKLILGSKPECCHYEI